MRFKRNDESIGMGAWMFASLALILGLGALIVAGRALTQSDDAKSIASASTGTQVSLTEFKIDPSTIAVDDRWLVDGQEHRHRRAQPRDQGHQPEDSRHRPGQDASRSTSRR